MSGIQSLHSPSVEDYDDGASTSNDERFKSPSQHVHEPSSPAAEAGTPTSIPPPKPLGQKRRRVTRACDECRRKKIKCDGKQPCTHCTVYSYGQYSIDEHPEVRSAGHASVQLTSLTRSSQIAPMINRRIASVTRLLSTLKLWKSVCNAQRCF